MKIPPQKHQNVFSIFCSDLISESDVNRQEVKPLFATTNNVYVYILLSDELTSSFLCTVLLIKGKHYCVKHALMFKVSTLTPSLH